MRGEKSKQEPLLETNKEDREEETGAEGGPNKIHRYGWRKGWYGMDSGGGGSGRERARQTEGTGWWRGHLGEKEADEPDGGKWVLMGGSVWGWRRRQIDAG